MTTFANEKVRCGHCGQKSDQHVLASTNQMGSPDLDLRPPEMARSTMHVWLQQCPHCGYIAADLKDAPADPAVITSAGYQAALRREDLPVVARRFLAFALASADSAIAAQSYLRAAWACDDAQLPAAVECRRAAAYQLRHAIAAIADAEQRPMMVAVLVDVLRRAEDFPAASAEAETLLATPGLPDILQKVITAQQRLIAAGDVAAHTVADVVK
jgi:hypothetical protein